MITRPRRGYNQVAIAIIFAAVLISASLLLATGEATRTTTATSTITTSLTTTITVTSYLQPSTTVSSSSCTNSNPPCGSGEIVPVSISITNSAFQPSQLTLTGDNNTVTFFDNATNPPLVKLASESPWPSGFTAVERGLTYGANYTVTLNVPGVYHFVDAESVDQGNLTIDVMS